MIDFIENPKKVTKEEVEIWEKENNIFLPDDYKNFLVNVGVGELKDADINGLIPIYVKKEPEIEIYDPITKKISYKKINPENYIQEDLYIIWSFISLDDIIKENNSWSNYNANDSSLLIFATSLNYQLYSICINKNSNNYGKIYYTKPSHHYTFDYLNINKNDYENLPILENNFSDFIENIELIPEL